MILSRSTKLRIKLCIYLSTVLNITHHLRSLSTMVTVALPGLPRVTLSGSEDESIVRVKSSLPSNRLSSVIGTLNGALVTPAGNVTAYGPES